jgi:hypothetical protein
VAPLKVSCDFLTCYFADQLPLGDRWKPVTSLDARYSEDNAQPTPWPDAVTQLERAGLFWVSSVRADGRPHVTPVVAVWMDGALYFSSGPGEQKSKNLARPTGTAR